MAVNTADAVELRPVTRVALPAATSPGSPYRGLERIANLAGLTIDSVCIATGPANALAVRIGELSARDRRRLITVFSLDSVPEVLLPPENGMQVLLGVAKDVARACGVELRVRRKTYGPAVSALGSPKRLAIARQFVEGTWLEVLTARILRKNAVGQVVVHVGVGVRINDQLGPVFHSDIDALRLSKLTAVFVEAKAVRRENFHSPTLKKAVETRLKFLVDWAFQDEVRRNLEPRFCLVGAEVANARLPKVADRLSEASGLRKHNARVIVSHYRSLGAALGRMKES